MIKRLVHWKDRMMLNAYTPNKSLKIHETKTDRKKRKREKMTELKGEIDKS